MSLDVSVSPASEFQSLVLATLAGINSRQDAIGASLASKVFEASMVGQEKQL